MVWYLSRTNFDFLGQFNVLWLNPESPETFPEGLLDALDDPALVTSIQQRQAGHSIEGRLRAKMQADALRPLKSTLEDLDEEGETGIEKSELRKEPYSEEELQEAIQFLRLGVGPLFSLRGTVDLLSPTMYRRRRTASRWCWITSAGSTRTASGAALSTRTRRTWRTTVQAKMKMHTIEPGSLVSSFIPASFTAPDVSAYILRSRW